MQIPNWYHYNCFFKKAKNFYYTSQLKGFDMLRWGDQNKIKEKLGLATSKLEVDDDDKETEETNVESDNKSFQF